MSRVKSKGSSLSLTNETDDFETMMLHELQASERNKVTPVSLMTLCHPFIAYQITVNKQFLTKHSLLLDNVYTFHWEEARHIVDEAIQEFSNYRHVKYQAGGYAFVINNLIQWLLAEPKSVATICASGGMDNEVLRTLLKKVVRMGVLLLVEQIENAEVSVNLVLHCDKKRCELYIGDFKVIATTQIFLDKPIVSKMLERTNCFFIGDTSISFQSKTAMKLAEFAFMRFKQFIMAVFNVQLLHEHKQTLIDLLVLTDVLFLTPQCCKGLIRILDIKLPCCSCGTGRETRAISRWLTANSEKNCIIITSDGRRAYVHSGLTVLNKTSRFDSPYFNSREVVDDYGVNYGFVAGFIAMMLQGCALEVNVDAGFFAASLISKKFDAILQASDAKLFKEWKNKYMKSDTPVEDVDRMTQIMPFTMFPTPWKPNDRILNVSDSAF